jgi:hypothetical protein
MGLLLVTEFCSWENVVGGRVLSVEPCQISIVPKYTSLNIGHEVHFSIAEEPSPYRDMDYSRVSRPPHDQSGHDRTYSCDAHFDRLTPEKWGGPEYRATPTRYAMDSSAVDFEARDRASQNRHAPPLAPAVKFNILTVIRNSALVRVL